MTKQQKQNRLLTCLQVACERVCKVHVYFNYNKETDMYANCVTLYDTDRAVSIFEKTLQILNSGHDEVESINYSYHFSVCDITLK